MATDKRDTQAQPPLEKERPEIDSPAKSAGGIPAVTSALKISVKEMGVTRTAKALLKVNQTDGFDCPGCAWPDPDDRRSMVEFCENGAKAVAEEATKKRVDPGFFKKCSVSELSKQSDYWLSQQGRLTHPMLLRAGSDHYEPVSWEEAFSLIARELNALSSPNEAIFYTSGRTSNEAAFLYQLFVRLYGTNNLPDCSNMCHESSGVALMETLGSGKGSVRLSDFDHADCILVIGQNPGTNHPRMLSSLQKAAQRGCRIISINPISEAGLKRFQHPQKPWDLISRGTPIASHHYPVRINGDVALLKGVMKALVEIDDKTHGAGINHDFVSRYTTGFEAFVSDLRRESWAIITSESGIEENQIRELAGIIRDSQRLIACWAMGLTQHRNAVGNIQQIVNLLLMRGQLGKKGAGACPVRGHSNVQGDRTMGIWEAHSEAFLSRLEQEFGFKAPRAHGYHVVSAIEAMLHKKATVFISLGGNLLSAGPDTEITAEAIKNCRLSVQISTKLNRSHLVTARQALILPCLGRSEIDLQESGPQFVSVENSMGIVHPSQGNLPPASEYLKSEVAIVAGMAKATLKASNVNWDEFIHNYDSIRDRIERVIPGFNDFNKRIRTPGGFELPHAVRDELRFNTPDGKGGFTVHPIPRNELKPNQFLLMTIRTHDQYNTTVYGLEDRYRGIKGGRRVVLLNPKDIEALGLKEGSKVDIISHFEGKERVASEFLVVGYEIPRRCAASYFPEANVLVLLESYAEKSHTPTSKSIVVSFRHA